MKKQLKGYIEKIEGDDGVLSVAVATDSSIDRDGEVIDSNGWDFNNFLKNPVLLWAHDYREEPLGKVENLRKEGDRILFQPRLAIDISEKAARVYALMKEGYINAFSVGFIPKEHKDATDPSGRTVRTFTKAELLEISVVPVPANPNALVMARSFAEQKGWNFDDLGIKDTEEETKTEEPEQKQNDTFTDEQKTAIGEIVKTQVDAAVKEVAAELTSLKELIAGKNGNDEKKVENTQGDDGVELAKRVLQAIDKGMNEALRSLKAAQK